MEGHFDRWAASYDADVRADPKGFPFAGYDAVLDALAETVRAAGARRVLELGIGTGNLAARVFAAVPGVELWGVDFSAGMLARAGVKVPRARLVRGEIEDLVALSLPPTVDAVVAAYVLHELPDDRKLALIEGLLRERVAPGGVIAIGDIAFTDAAHFAAVREAQGASWDPSEHYFVADRFLAECAARGIAGEFRPLSFCGGVFVLRRRGERR
ncbi:MAG: class I SAM-dependent methyltransferase [Chloroflexota bacterium]|nr:class I SAM-dependent methyltransferase [Chloroflexota bacterium]